MRTQSMCCRGQLSHLLPRPSCLSGARPAAVGAVETPSLPPLLAVGLVFALTPLVLSTGLALLLPVVASAAGIGSAEIVTVVGIERSMEVASLSVSLPVTFSHFLGRSGCCPAPPLSLCRHRRPHNPSLLRCQRHLLPAALPPRQRHR